MITGILHLFLWLTNQILRFSTHGAVNKAHTGPDPPTIKPKFPIISEYEEIVQMKSMLLPLNYACYQDLVHFSISGPNTDGSFVEELTVSPKEAFSEAC